MFAGAVGGIGLFFVGMQLLTGKPEGAGQPPASLDRSNLDRESAGRIRPGNDFRRHYPEHVRADVRRGELLRSGLVSTSGAFSIILGANLGVTLLVLVVSFDVKLISLYALGIASAIMISERASGYPARLHPARRARLPALRPRLAFGPGGRCCSIR